MIDPNYNYPVRYFTGPWNKPVPQLPKTGTQVVPGVSTSGDDNFGYADYFMLVSGMKDKSGEIKSLLLLDSESGAAIKRSTLELIQDHIEHHLGKHCAEVPALIMGDWLEAIGIKYLKAKGYFVLPIEDDRELTIYPKETDGYSVGLECVYNIIHLCDMKYKFEMRRLLKTLGVTFTE